MKLASKSLTAAAVTMILIIAGCGKDLPVKYSLKEKKYTLLNQDSVEVNYPDIAKGKITVIGYIYTNCPDICPLTTNNMRVLQEELKERGINENVKFISVSFDPQRDTPTVLKNYARVRNLDLSNWDLLTGDETDVKQLLKDDEVIAAVSDSSKKTGSYYIAHTDRISLMDGDAQIRKHYKGSQAAIQEIVEDINTLINN